MSLVDEYLRVRGWTEQLAAPLSAEDQQLQAMPEASPVKWHRGHTAWFFETFLLLPHGAAPFRPRWGKLFNSYYEALGPRHARPHRGLLSRPTADEVGAYRRHVDGAMVDLLCSPAGQSDECRRLVELGLAHEQQHQELLLTDVLAAFAGNPLRPCYHTSPLPADAPPRERALRWQQHAGGLTTIGADDDADNDGGFAFDNERPRHQVFLLPFAVANRLVTVGEWAAFAADGGYDTPSLWLSEGLDWVRANAISGPGYLTRDGTAVTVFGLQGERLVHPQEPVLHLSYYEADALATWMGARLPTEAEWESVAAQLPSPERASPSDPLPSGIPPASEGDMADLYGSGWQWTRSSYAPYPGFRPAKGALGEYNGKFMINQQVLRGSSLFTPRGHSRPSYRNFWHPHTQFQATAVRLAKDVEGAQRAG